MTEKQKNTRYSNDYRDCESASFTQRSLQGSEDVNIGKCTYTAAAESFF